MYDDFNHYRFNYLCKFYTIPKLKRMKNKFFLCILFILSGDTNINLRPVYNKESLDTNEWNIFKSSKCIT